MPGVFINCSLINLTGYNFFGNFIRDSTPLPTPVTVITLVNPSLNESGVRKFHLREKPQTQPRPRSFRLFVLKKNVNNRKLNLTYKVKKSEIFRTVRRSTNPVIE